LDENINIIKKNTEAVLDAIVEVSEQVKTFMSRHQTTGQNHYIKEDNK
jgi:hypothetical protein